MNDVGLSLPKENPCRAVAGKWLDEKPGKAPSKNTRIWKEFEGQGAWRIYGGWDAYREQLGGGNGKNSQDQKKNIIAGRDGKKGREGKFEEGISWGQATSEFWRGDQLDWAQYKQYKQFSQIKLWTL